MDSRRGATTEVGKSFAATMISNPRTIRIGPVRSTEDIEAAATLFAKYAQSLGIDLAFQEFDHELKTLPGKYAPPSGEILLARDINGMAVGCVALRPLNNLDACELKRLYILPESRGLGLGKKLLHEIIAVAASLEYREMKLDTLNTMTEAIDLYTRAGFVPTQPYYDNPLEAVVYLARQLKEVPLS